jgi:hypothetical protein
MHLLMLRVCVRALVSRCNHDVHESPWQGASGISERNRTRSNQIGSVCRGGGRRFQTAVCQQSKPGPHDKEQNASCASLASEAYVAFHVFHFCLDDVLVSLISC